MHPSADLSCKQLFIHPEVVRELVRAAIPPAWLDLAGLRRCKGGHVWRLQQHHGPPLYLLLEFQAQPDHWMALRMQVHSGLLCQDLLRQQRLRDKTLPLLLPVVVYTGQAPWTASVQLSALRGTPRARLADFQPGQDYLLVDLASLKAQPAPERSVLASLLAFDQFSGQRSDHDELLFALTHVNAWLGQQHNLALSQVIRDWVIQRLQARFAGVRIPEDISLLEMHALLKEELPG